MAAVVDGTGSAYAVVSLLIGKSGTAAAVSRIFGGAGGIRTLDRALQPYNGLANRRLQPLGHSSVEADMPDTGASRKRWIAGCRIPGRFNDFTTPCRGYRAGQARY
jgi:hypothetical protein